MNQGKAGEHLNPAPIVDLAMGYWKSLAMLALNELDCFTAIARADGGTTTADGLAADLDLDPRAAGMLLDAGVSLGLLTKDAAGRYRNTAMTDAFLVAGRPTYMGGALRYASDMVGAWARLAEAVRTGEPQVPPAAYLGDDSERTRRYVYGMYDRGMGVAAAAVDAIEMPRQGRLLDIGGGSGVFSILLGRKYPEIEAEVLDLPPVVQIAAEIIANHGLSDRITVRGADLMTDDLGEGYDAVLVSGVLHRFLPDDCARLLARAAAAVRPGGTVIVVDVMLDDDHAGPSFATLFALNMLLSAQGGGAHSVSDHVGWLQAAGLSDVSVRRLSPPFQETVVQGWGPGGR